MHLAAAVLLVRFIASSGSLEDEAAKTHSITCPVALLELEDKDGLTERLVLRDNAVLSSLRSPLYLVPMLGVYRGGKSFVLNRLRGLSAPYAGGFDVGHGQSTHTRGISACAEEVAGLGTIVWMDTEGIFSSEEARSAYGSKLFSLALLFGSTVLLNSVKVLNDQFFAFFGEQQQLAAMIKDGLAKEGLPLEALGSEKLGIFWIVQQPIAYDRKSDALSKQLNEFLNVKKDEARARVRDGFNHSVHGVATATYDSRVFGRLNTLVDSDLAPDYITSTKDLRESILAHLHHTRSLPAVSVEAWLRMFVDLVDTEKFDGK